MDDRIKQLHDAIEETKQEAAEANGKLKAAKERLLKEFKCKTVKAAKVLLEKLESEVQELEEELEEGLAEMEERYGLE